MQDRLLRLGVTLLALLLSTSLMACEGGESASDIIRSDSAGVEIVVSLGEDRVLGWTLQREFELGGKETGPESFFRVKAMYVGVDAGRRIYVLNNQESHVAIFSPEGDFIRTVGAPGEGPGEISRGGTLSVSPEGTVSVFDYGKGGLVRFGPEGESLPTMVFPYYPQPGPSRHMAETEEGFFVYTRVHLIEENTGRYAVQLIAEADTILVAARLVPEPAEWATFPSCRYGVRRPRIFEALVSWTALEGTVVVSRTDLYELELFQEGRLVRKFQRSLGPRPATVEMAMAEIGEEYTVNIPSGRCTVPAREVVDALGFAETIPWIEQVILAPGGDLWVGRFEVSGNAPRAIDIFASSGEYRGTLPPGTPFPLVFLDPNRFGAMENDAMDIERLVVYRILR